MGIPTSATDYPAFSGSTVKQEILRALLEYAHESSGLMDVILKINRTNISTVTDGATVYATAGSFAAAE